MLIVAASLHKTFSIIWSQCIMKHWWRFLLLDLVHAPVTKNRHGSTPIGAATPGHHHHITRADDVHDLDHQSEVEGQSLPEEDIDQDQDDEVPQAPAVKGLGLGFKKDIYSSTQCMHVYFLLHKIKIVMFSMIFSVKKIGTFSINKCLCTKNRTKRNTVKNKQTNKTCKL